MNITKKMKFIKDYTLAKNAASGSQYDANANVTMKNISTMECELGKKDLIDVNRAITEKYLKQLYGEELIEQYEKDLANHIEYVHDETSLKPYCAAISLPGYGYDLCLCESAIF